MKTTFVMLISILLLLDCNNTSQLNQKGKLEIADEFIAVFYSFDKDSLQAFLNKTDESGNSILYYQGWAECGNYQIIKRHNCFEKNDSVVVCPVTVKDDLISALGINFNVTDTFHLTIVNGQIRSIQTSSNDPDKYYQAKVWVQQNRPELIEKPCEGIWEDGTTPCECVQAMVQGFKEFANQMEK